jgi:hypothetical protein
MYLNVLFTFADTTDIYYSYSFPQNIFLEFVIRYSHLETKNLSKWGKRNLI